MEKIECVPLPAQAGLKPEVPVVGDLNEVSTDLFPEIVDVDLDRRIEKVNLRTPDVTQEVLMTNRFMGILCKEKQQLKLGLAEADHFAACFH